MVIEGKKLAQKIKDMVKNEVTKLDTSPKFWIIQVGDNDASDIYVRNKIKACEYCGIDVTHEHISSFIETNQLKALIQNKQTNYDAVMIQMPLPSHIDTNVVINAIDPNKDVDGLTEVNIGRLWSNSSWGLFPCTALGIIEYLKYIIKGDAYDYQYTDSLISSPSDILTGMNVCVIGRSNLVGKPVSALLQRENCTVTMCHSKTSTSALKRSMSHSDVIISAIGKAEYFDIENFINGQILIDVGINRNANNKLCGDIRNTVINCPDLYDCQVTPVPGGVGLLTVAMLMVNILKAYKYVNKGEDINGYIKK